eukprot:COSAG02_NODE_8242_length_2645_cov_1.472113_4_plen_160_part_00
MSPTPTNLWFRKLKVCGGGPRPPSSHFAVFSGCQGAQSKKRGRREWGYPRNFQAGCIDKVHAATLPVLAEVLSARLRVNQHTCNTRFTAHVGRCGLVHVLPYAPHPMSHDTCHTSHIRSTERRSIVLLLAESPFHTLHASRSHKARDLHRNRRSKWRDG